MGSDASVQPRRRSALERCRFDACDGQGRRDGLFEDRF